MLKPILTTAIVAATFLIASARAQTQPAVAPVVTPSSPAPAVAPAASAAPNQVIYVPRLPGVAELQNAAAASAGVTVERIEQSSAQISVTYKYANGQTNTVAYQLLPTANPPVQPQTTVVHTSPAPAVVYAPPPRVVYYEEPIYYPRYYYPYYPPVSFSLGFGYSRGFGGFGHGHRHHGGFHHRR
jgi:hypothetical protein